MVFNVADEDTRLNFTAQNNNKLGFYHTNGSNVCVCVFVCGIDI